MINLPVPYGSEWDGDSSKSPNDCGPTSASMILKYYKKNVSSDEIFNKTGAGQGMISVQQLMNAIRSFGFNCEYKVGQSIQALKDLLDKGIPALALVHAGSLGSRQDQGFKGGHFVVVVGYREDGYFVNDPDFWGNFRKDGDHHFYTKDEFESAWSNCHLDENPDYSMIVIHPNEPEQLPVKLGLSDRELRDAYNVDIIKLCNDLGVNQDDTNRIAMCRTEIANLQREHGSVGELSKKLQSLKDIANSKGWALIKYVKLKIALA